MGNWKIDVDGTLKDFADDLEFHVSTSIGTGIVPIENLENPQGLLPGSSVDDQNIKARRFSLRGSIYQDQGETQSDWHDKRQVLIKALMSYPSTINQTLTPRTLRFTGATADKEINALYDGGLESGFPISKGDIDIDIRFIAPDPFFYATSETITALDTLDSPTIRTVVAKIGGIWNDLGPPDSGGSYALVYDLAEDDTYIYVAGAFTNFDNIAAADRVVRWNKSTETWSALATLNATVYALAVAPDGTLYLGGAFTNAGGVAAADYICSWNGSAYAAVGTPNTGAASITDVRDITIAANGDIYVTGDFTNFGDVANADQVAYYDISGSAWAAVGTPPFGVGPVGTDINFDSAGNLYAAVSDLYVWDGSSWTDLNSNVAGIQSMYIDDNDNVYVGGTTTPYLEHYNGQQFIDTTNSSLSAGVYSIAKSPNGDLYLGSTETQISIWNGSVVNQADIDLPGSPTVAALLFTEDDDFWIGCGTTGTANLAGDTTISYSGTAVSYPYIEIDRSGGTTAQLLSIRNETTGAIIYSNYQLLDGEQLTFEFRSSEGIGVTSDFFGSVPGAVLPNSDQSNFYLVPGNGSGSKNNIITVFVLTTGSPTITANIKYKVAYLSYD